MTQVSSSIGRGGPIPSSTSEHLTGLHDGPGSPFPSSALELDQFRQVQRLAYDIALTVESQLQVGMTRSQVRYLLGTPMVPAVFDKDRWDYVYYFKHGRLRRPEERHLIVFFTQDKVTRFDRDNVPNAPPQAPEQGPPVSKFPRI